MAVIDRDDDLYRRVAPNFIVKGERVSSAAYKVNGRPDTQISVNWAKLSSPEDTRRTRPTFGVGRLQAAVPIDMELTVQHDPEPDNPAHTLMLGVSEPEQCRMLADATVIVLPPPGAHTV